MIKLAIIFVNLLGLYFALGLLFAIAFQLRGLHKVDAGTAETSIWFKILIFPGTIAFWPVLLSKWIKAKQNDKNT